MTLNRILTLMIPSLVYILVSQLIQLHNMTKPVPRTKTGQINMGGPKILKIDDDLKFWVSEFETAARANGMELNIDSLIVRYESDSQFRTVTMPDGSTKSELATCSLAFGSAPLIQVKKSYFVNASEWHKREIMFHELGHCILGLDHNDHRVNGKTVSIMNSVTQGDAVYNAMTATQYDTELFKSTNKIRALIGTK